LRRHICKQWQNNAKICARTDEFLVQHFYCRAPVFYVPADSRVIIKNCRCRTDAPGICGQNFAYSTRSFGDARTENLPPHAARMQPLRKYLYTMRRNLAKTKQLQVMETKEFRERKRRESMYVHVSNSILQMKSSGSKIIMVHCHYPHKRCSKEQNKCSLFTEPEANNFRRNSIMQGAYDFYVKSRTLKFLSLFK
jgi:hypothetical protein